MQETIEMTSSDSPALAGTIRVLLVDDYAPFRKFVRLALGMNPGLQIAGEASDGLDAVQKTEELRPDLILLDIGLPTLNGIEVARRIRELSPKTRILFVSQELSPDVVREALGTGAFGYVIKANAARDLSPAVAAVCQGKQFLSKELLLS
jgi:DNA-binding NarL/FixJ family response regulator